MTSSDCVAAVINTPSTPRSLANPLAIITGSSFLDKSTVSAPNFRANSHFLESKSIPNTLHPLARNICTHIRPINPRPVTTKHSPIVGCIKRIPCNPIAPKTVNAADSLSTVSGIFTQRFFGTRTTSA